MDIDMGAALAVALLNAAFRNCVGCEVCLLLRGVAVRTR